MPLFPPQQISELGVALFMAVGAARDQAQATTESLIISSLMGHDSHGVIRIPEYLGHVAEGTIVVDARPAVQRTGPATAVVDGNHGFGAVGAETAIREGIEIARAQRSACVLTRNCNHVGRLGAWVQLAADQELIALATCNSPIKGHYVLPWGGRAGRLGTNPMAYAVPSGGNPIVADFSTSVAPEGKVRVYRNQGKKVPDGWIVDSRGQPTNDPNAFYGPPLGGLLPIGGSAGHKGFALSLLVEILGSTLAGFSTQDPHVVGNGVCFFVIDPSAFCPLDHFKKLVDETIAYMKSSPPAPGVEEVLVPGEMEFRTMKQRKQTGIPVDDATLQGMREHGARLKVNVDRYLG